MDTRAKLASRVRTAAYPNDMLAMLPRIRRSQTQAQHTALPAKREHTLQMRHRAHPAPKATTALEVHLYPQNAKTYRRTALLARLRRKSPKQARTQTPSAQQRSYAKKAITARADVASSVHQDRTVLLSSKSHRRPCGDVHKRKSNERNILRARILLQERHQA